MALCVSVDVDGALFVVDPQPVETSACGLVIVSGQEASVSPFALTVEQGSQIGVAILMLWAVAWSVRVVARVLAINSDVESEK